MVNLDTAIADAGYDGSVAAATDPDQWVVTFGVDATDTSHALNEGLQLLTKFVGNPGTVVSAMVIWVTELERQARLGNMPQLVGASEVATLLGVSRQRVHQLYQQNDAFPIPLVQVAMGPLWDERAIRAFDRGWSRQPGRPSANAVTMNKAIREAGRA